jgi:hypothetical protein
MVAQARSLSAVRNAVTLNSFCHAQSADKWDFMSTMGLRSFEAGMADAYDYVYVNSTLLQELLERTFPGIQVVVSGHVYNSDDVLSVLGITQQEVFNYPKEKLCIFTSRLDYEKQPQRFVQFARHERRPPGWQFLILSGYDELRSYNNGSVIREIERAETDGILEVRPDLSKKEYYEYLLRASVQVSCSLQDWTSFCLLEAVTFGCCPLYPNYRSFPEAFGMQSNCLYPFSERMKKEDVIDAMWNQFPGQAGSMQRNRLFCDIVAPHNKTVDFILDHMGVIQ